MISVLKKTIILCAGAALALGAQAASIRVGYCDGALAEKGYGKTGKTEMSGAVILTPEMLEPYIGCNITAVRAGITTTEGMTGFNVWVRGSLDGENLESMALEEPQQGWNEVALSGSLAVDGSPLAVGFSFSQEKAVRCFSFTGDNRPDTRWLCKNGKWEEAKVNGVLSIELVVTGDNLPSSDLALKSATPVKPIMKEGEDAEIHVVMKNEALTDIYGYSLSYSIDGGKETVIDIDGVVLVQQTVGGSIIIGADEITPGQPHEVTVKAITGIDDNPDNNTLTCLLGAYTDSMPRRVLIEEFTTENCGNCPRAINTLKQCEEAGYGDRMAVVAHHAGYYTDWLTTDTDLKYEWFYDPTGQSGTYAPAVMLDRVVLEGQSVPVNSIGYFKDFEPTLQTAIERPAFVSVGVSSAFDEATRTLDVAVSGEKLDIFDVVGADSRISIYVVEDGIPHRRQAGISSDTFTHSHVFRTCLTDVWGDAVEWDGNRMETKRSVAIPEDWEADNLSVVAFIHNHNMDDVADCEVFNTAVAKAGESGVESVEADEVVAVSYHRPDGTPAKADDLSSGLLIKTTVYSDGSRKTTKIIR